MSLSTVAFERNFSLALTAPREVERELLDLARGTEYDLPRDPEPRPIPSAGAYVAAVRRVTGWTRAAGPDGRVIAAGWRACPVRPSDWLAPAGRGQAWLAYWAATQPRPAVVSSCYNDPPEAAARAFRLGIPAERYPLSLARLLPASWHRGRRRALAVLRLARRVAGLPDRLGTADLRRLARLSGAFLRALAEVRSLPLVVGAARDRVDWPAVGQLHSAWLRLPRARLEALRVPASLWLASGTERIVEALRCASRRRLGLAATVARRTRRERLERVEDALTGDPPTGAPPEAELYVVHRLREWVRGPRYVEHAWLTIRRHRLPGGGWIVSQACRHTGRVLRRVAVFGPGREALRTYEYGGRSTREAARAVRLVLERPERRHAVTSLDDVINASVSSYYERSQSRWLAIVQALDHYRVHSGAGATREAAIADALRERQDALDAVARYVQCRDTLTSRTARAQLARTIARLWAELGPEMFARGSERWTLAHDAWLESRVLADRSRSWTPVLDRFAAAIRCADMHGVEPGIDLWAEGPPAPEDPIRLLEIEGPTTPAMVVRWVLRTATERMSS